MLVVEAQTPPIKMDDHGTMRVGGTRVTLDTVVYSFEQGHSAEEIVSQFPVLKLADVYAVISYYLNHRAEVEQYLQKQEEEAEAIWRKIEAMPGYHEFREELHRRRQAYLEAQAQGK